MLDEDSVPPADRERLTQIGDVVPLMVRRIRRVRVAVLIIWMATGAAQVGRRAPRHQFQPARSQKLVSNLVTAS